MAFIPTSDFFYLVATGQLPGYSRGAFGSNNPSLGIDTLESVDNRRLETGTGDVYTYMNVDTTLYISSSSASDTQTVVIIGMDENYVKVNRLATLNGQTPVEVTGQLFRVFSVVIISDPKAVGNIYLSDDNVNITDGVPDSLTNVKGRIDSGTKAFFSTNFTVADGQEAYLFEFTPSSSKAGDVDVLLRFRLSTTEDFGPAPPFQAFQSSSTFVEKMGINLPARTDIDLIATSPTGGSKCTVAFTMVLKDVTA